MKYFLFFFLSFFALPSQGQQAVPKCWPEMTLPITLTKASAAAISYGEIVYAASQIGLVWGYTCKAPDNQYYKVIAAGAWDIMPKEWLYIADTLMRGTDADRSAAWTKYVTATQWDSRLKSDIDAVWAKLPNAPPPPPPPPPPSTWKVLADPFRADKKRLIYTVVNGKRGSPTGQYIDAGQPCDPVTMITELGPIYFLSVNNNPALVARCTK